MICQNALHWTPCRFVTLVKSDQIKDIKILVAIQPGVQEMKTWVTTLGGKMMTLGGGNKVLKFAMIQKMKL